MQRGRRPKEYLSLPKICYDVSIFYGGNLEQVIKFLTYVIHITKVKQADIWLKSTRV